MIMIDHRVYYLHKVKRAWQVKDGAGAVVYESNKGRCLDYLDSLRYTANKMAHPEERRATQERRPLHGTR